MGTKANVDAAVAELTGDAPAVAPKAAKAKAPHANKAVKPANTKAKAKGTGGALTKESAEGYMAAGRAAKAPVATAKAATAKAAKPTAKVAPKPAAKAAKAPAKPAAKAVKANGKAKAASTQGLVSRGTGKFFFEPTEREALRKELAQKVRKPVSTKEYAAEHGHDTWKVRLAAADLTNQGKMKLVKVKGSAVLTMQKVG